MMSQPKLQFRITGMDCAEEVSILKREVGPLVGGEDRLSFDILNAKMTVSALERLEADTIVSAVARTGMRAEPWTDPSARKTQSNRWQDQARAITTVVSGVCLALGFLAHVLATGSWASAFGAEIPGGGHDIPTVSKAFYLAAVLSAGWLVLPRAWFALRRFSPDMNLLMTIAVGGAIAIGEWFEAGAVYFLFALSLMLEAWSVGRARRAVEALMELAPMSVRVLQNDGSITEVAPDEVLPGSRFLVRPGERFPLDGRVVAGSSEVNQAPITGESRPVAKGPEAEVFAGTINGDGALEVVSTKPASDTTLARIIRMVSEAQSRRSPSERWVERFARIYTPAVLALAVVVLVVPPLIAGASWSEWLYRALVLLVISCPCALVISTPVSIVAALTASARQGVLVKGGVYMEAPARLRAVAFDKTGTLTQGRPQVLALVPLNRHTEEELLSRAAALESHSDHPLARAIVRHANERNLAIGRVEEFQIFKGKGATARLDGREFWLGSHRYLEERGQETPEVNTRAAELSRSGHSVVAVGNAEHVCGLIALGDAVRSEAKSTIDRLRHAGVERIVMLTGDNRDTAAAIAKETGVDEFYAELLPEDKVRIVEKLVADLERVAMVGDGVNDAPAMARASVGIAMGAAGSDAAIEAADIALMSDELLKLPWLISHSRRTLRVIKENITLSIAVKVLFVALTFAGYASLWAAIAADMGVSLLVIFNALRLLNTGSSESTVV
jgi:Cd2+/Zn2+-exporting ATPase